MRKLTLFLHGKEIPSQQTSEGLSYVAWCLEKMCKHLAETLDIDIDADIDLEMGFFQSLMEQKKYSKRIFLNETNDWKTIFQKIKLMQHDEDPTDINFYIKTEIVNQDEIKFSVIDDKVQQQKTSKCHL